jgi:hypothetical protein
MSNTVTIKNINDITNLYVPSGTPKDIKETVINKYINPTKYEFVGFLDRSNEAVLRPRFHNVRDSYGRFARVEETL